MQPNKVVNNASQTMATTSSVVSEATYGGAKRVALVLQNTSTGGETISVAVGRNAISGQGIFLKEGATMSWSQDGGYMPPQDAVHALGSAATATLSIYEEVEYE